MRARETTVRSGRRPPRIAGILVPALLCGTLLAAACSSAGASGRAAPGAWSAAVEVRQDEDEGEEQAEVFRPLPETTAGDDWIRLVSGEWLRGELTGLDRDRVEFDSLKLGKVQLDWADVAEVVTGDPFTLLLADRSTVVGVPQVSGDAIRVRTGEGGREFSRGDIEGFVRGTPRERNYWSGRVKLGGTVRSGNTDQVDSTLSIATTRRTAASRLNLSLDSVVGSVDGSKSIDNQTFRGSLDYYISPRVYARPLGIELFRDRFQNIDLRASPYTALGYVLLDRGGTEWDVTAGLGYRYTRYDSVEEGEDDTEDVMTGVVGTTYANELTDDIDLEFAYNAQIGLEDTSNTNQDAALGLTFEFLWDLDFDFRLVWKRVGMPAADADGEIPDEDDLRLDVGVSWGF